MMYDELVKRLRYAASYDERIVIQDCKEAADAIEELQAQLMYSNDAAKAIADKVPKWIPVTERLPNPRESVIISVNGKYGDWIGEGCYWETTENHVIWKGYRWNATYWDDEIIAWMPLPEPWEGGQDG